MSALIAISTYLKNKALEDLIQTLIHFKYQDKILITDDSDNFTALSVYNKFRHHCDIAYLGGSKNLGIAGNKNRSLWYFLEKSKCDYLLSLDDDILITEDGLINHLKSVLRLDNLPFITGLWTDFNLNREESVKQLYGNGGWFSQFPKVAESAFTTWHNGCHGCLVFYTRKAIERVGYFNHDWIMKYGFEHSLYCSRILRSYGSAPELFPIMKFSETFFHGNNIPNNYEIDREKVFQLNGNQHKQFLLQVYRGCGINIPDSGIKKALKTDKLLEGR